MTADGDMVVTGDEAVQSHILILCKDRSGRFRAYLDGHKVKDEKLKGNNPTHLLQKTRKEINDELPFQILVGHKRTGDDGLGKAVDHFHGFIYDIGVFPYCPQEFELNIMYRSLKLDHDIHLRQHWDRQNTQYRQDNGHINYKFN